MIVIVLVYGDDSSSGKRSKGCGGEHAAYLDKRIDSAEITLPVHCALNTSNQVTKVSTD